MKEQFKWVLYVAVLLVGLYIASQNVDAMKHANPPQKFLGQFPPETAYLMPFIVLFLFILFLRWLENARVLQTQHGTPTAYIFVNRPISQDDIAHYKKLAYPATGRKFLFIINALRSFKQKHKGQRISSVLDFTAEEKKKFLAKADYPYLYDDALSQEELVGYLLNEGSITIDGYNHRMYLSEYAHLVDVGNIKILEVRGMPNSVEEQAIALTAEGESEKASQLLSSRYGERGQEQKKY